MQSLQAEVELFGIDTITVNESSYIVHNTTTPMNRFVWVFDDGRDAAVV